MVHKAKLGNATYSAEIMTTGAVKFSAPTQKARELYLPEDLVLQVAEEIKLRRALRQMEKATS